MITQKSPLTTFYHQIKLLSILLILIYCQCQSNLSGRCCLIDAKQERFSWKNRISSLHPRNRVHVNNNPIKDLLNTRAGASSSSSSITSRDRLMIMCVSIRSGGNADDENGMNADIDTDDSNEVVDNEILTTINSSSVGSNNSTNEKNHTDTGTQHEAIISISNETEITTLSSSSTTRRSRKSRTLDKYIKKRKYPKFRGKSSSILRESISSLSTLNSNGFNGFNGFNNFNNFNRLNGSNSTHHRPRKIGKRLSMWRNETTMIAKKLFLDKITLASTILVKSENENEHQQDNDEKTEDDGDDDQITFQSNLLRPGRSFHIVTTAAIPWFTGTAVNPLLRAAYLSKLVKQINQEKGSNNETEITKNMSSFEEEGNNTTTTSGQKRVTLVIPWLELEEDRLELYGEKFNFTSPNEQEQYIRSWLRDQAGMPEEADEVDGIQILFYPARYHSGLKSIFAMGDIVSLVLDETDEVDVCILEEPEHLNFYRAPGDGWTKKFNFVIGIIHTNYVEYASSHYSGLWTAPAIRVMSSAMVRAYCHVVIKLSETLQIFAEEKERTSNVHGVRSEFLDEGLRRSNEANGTEHEIKAERNESTDADADADAYFIGKLLWTKGLDGILEMESFYKRYTGDYFEIDIYGNGPDERSIKKAFHGRNQMKNNFVREDEIDESDDGGGYDDASESENETEKDNTASKYQNRKEKISHHVAKFSKQIQATTQTLKSTTESLDLELPQSLHEYRRIPIPAKFPGRVDHATLKQYKIFVNPSLSEVLCTTTAEALAMGKFVIIPVHPSNQFFMQFPNCLAYRNKVEFAANLLWAKSHEPEPLTLEQQQLFTWEAATDRLVKASSITRAEAKERQKLGTSKLDERIAWFHNEIGNGTKGDIIRKVLGAGPAAEQFRYTNRQSPDDNEEKAGGLSMKFVGSSLADALKQTFSNGIFAPAKTLTG